MRFELSLGNLRATAESYGGELVSLRDGAGTEYIWGGEAPYWSGRNPVLFPIVGRLKDGITYFDGRPYEMAQHGFARRNEFSVVEQGQDYVIFELRENEDTLQKYPFPFSLRVRHQLNADGFSTAFRVENTGDTPMPFCIGAHTAFRCPLWKGERFEDYQIVFDQPETVEKILLNQDNLVSSVDREPLLDGGDRFGLNYDTFARLDTVILEGLRSTGVSLLHKDTGRGVHMGFEGFPMVAFWTQGAQKAPFVCLEPWYGCAAVDNESGDFLDKRHCIVLQPGEVKELEYVVTLR